MDLAVGRGTAGDAVGNGLRVVEADAPLHGAELALVELEDVHDAVHGLSAGRRDGERQDGRVGHRLPGELADRPGLRPQLVQPLVRHHRRQRAQPRGGDGRVVIPRLRGGGRSRRGQ